MGDQIFAEERREKILDILNRMKRIKTIELSKEFKIGTATLRRDLCELEERGLVRRTHGGAILNDKTFEEINLNERTNQHMDEKERIARFISQIIRNGETLIIDGGSTTNAIASVLKTKTDLVIVTNSLSIASIIVGSNNNRVILAGGELQNKTHVMIGPITEYSLQQFRADKVILGMSSMIPEEGFFTANQFEAHIKRTMMKYGKEVIIAMDSSKIGKIMFSFVADLSMADKLVIDNGISKEDIARIEKKGLELIIV